MVAEPGGRGLTALVAELVTDPEPLTDAWRDLGERAFVDTVAVLMAGRNEPSVTVLAGTLDADETSGPARSLATGRSSPIRDAALLDGTSAHALDFDDVDNALIGHPSAVLVPTILAVGGAADVRGEDLLVAYRCGLLTARVLARRLGVQGHYAAGWHSTSTIGTLAAAASAARLWGLTGVQVRHSLGIAASMAAGSRQNFGSMTKPLHVGLAAGHGVLAARLAGRGYTADPDQLEGPLGYLALFGHPDRPVDAAPAEPDDGRPAGLNVKLYPCCYATHAAIDAALDLADRLADDAEIERIEVAVPPGALDPVIHHRPLDGMQAKFSLEYAVAVALLDRRVGLASFTDERVGRADVQRLLRTVHLSAAPVPPVGEPRWEHFFAAAVTVRTATADLRARVDQPAGHAHRPVSEANLRAKFVDCLSGAGVHQGTGPVEDGYQALRTLRTRPSARAVLGILTGATADPTTPTHR